MAFDISRLRSRLVASTAGLVAFLALGARANAQSYGADQAQLVDLSSLDGVAAVDLQADGSVLVTMNDGSTMTLAAGDVVVENGVVFADPGVLSAASAAAGIELNPYLIGAGVVGAGLIIAAASGDDDDDAPAPPPPPATVNNAPSFTSGDSVSVDENSAATGYTATADDADGDALTFSISGGADADLFEIDAGTGALSFVEAPDFEAPGDADGDNAYVVEVSVTDGEATASQTVTVTVNGIDDEAPVLVSGDAVTVTENGTEAFQAAAEDADSAEITFSLSGDDAALFAIDAATGLVTFIAAPDFENPADANGDNVYEVVVTATDGTNSTTQNVTVTVADQLELEGTDGDDVLTGTDQADIIDANGGDDIIDSGAGSDRISTGDGSDALLFSGDPFEGTDVSAEGRQIVGGEDFISDFDFENDLYQFDAEDYGVGNEVRFASLDANAEGASIPEGSNVIVLLNSDNDGDGSTPFLAGTAAAQIAALVDQPGPGFFVYWNSNLGQNRLVYSSDLSSADADLKIVSRQTDLDGQDAIDALANFSEDNFSFLSSVTVGDETGESLTGTEGADFIDGGAGDDTIAGLGGDDIIEGGDGADRIEGGGGSDTVTTGAGTDAIVFAGDPFDGADVSAEGRQIVGNEDFVEDFEFGTPTTTILVNEGTTSQAVVDAADAGNIYFNIHSVNAPAGEVRGQLDVAEDNRNADGVGSVTYTATLTGAAEVPPVDTEATGTGTVTFTIAEDGTVTYTTEIEIANFDVDTLTVGHFHEAPAGSNGPVVVDILADARTDGAIEGANLDGDTFTLNAADFGVEGEVSFLAIDANAEGAAIPAGTNVIVLTNADNDADPGTPFLAGTAAAQIAGLTEADGAGFFVYWNSNLGVNRLVYSTNLNDPAADLKIVARLTDLEGQDAIDALASFSAENFVFEDVSPTLLNIAAGSDDFDILEAALVATGLDAVVAAPGADLTVFAPTDAAFALLAQDLGIDTTGLSDAEITGEILGALQTIAGGEEEGLALLSDVLLYHVSPGAQDLAALQAAGTITTALADVTFSIDGTTLEDNDQTIADPQFVEGLTDIAAANGIIQVIDRVLLPVDVAGDDSETVALAEVIDGTVLDGGGEIAEPADEAADIATGDTIDLSGLGAGVSVDLDSSNQGALNPVEPTQVGVLTQGEATVTLNDFENVIGTDFDDTLFGNQESNVILGGDGDDNIHPFGGVDFVDGGAGTDTLNLSAGTGFTIDLEAGTAGPNTFQNFENVLGSVNGDDTILGDDGVNVLNGRDGDDTLNGRGGADTLIGGAGADTFQFSGDPFDGADVSAEGRQIVGNEDFIEDFDFASDTYSLNASDFGVEGDVSFLALDANAEGATIPAGTNVIILLNSDNDADPGTPFLAGTAAAQIAGLTEADGAGFFVYWNSNLGVNRLVYSTNLNDANADLKIVARQSDLEGQDAIDALASFSAENFVFEDVVEPSTPTVSFSESVDGDLSDDFAAPTDLGTLGLGDNTVEAQQGDGGDVDYVTFTIAEGEQLSAIILDDYAAGTGNLAFIGLQEGAAFTTAANATGASDLLGGLTYGEANEGSDILQAMGDLGGAIGFDGPLGAGTYTLWLNQTGQPSTASFTLRTETADEGAAAASLTVPEEIYLATGYAAPAEGNYRSYQPVEGATVMGAIDARATLPDPASMAAEMAGGPSVSDLTEDAVQPARSLDSDSDGWS